MPNYVSIYCRRHGFLKGPYRKTSIRIGNSTVENVTCAFCKECNAYYTTAMAIVMGKADPIDGIPVRQGKARLAHLDEQVLYDGKPTVKKGNSLVKKHNTAVTDQTSGKKKQPKDQQAHKGEQNETSVSFQPKDKRKVYLTAFPLDRCLCCNSTVNSYVLHLQEGSTETNETQYCWKCSTFYLLCYQKNINLMRRNLDSIDAIVLQNHVREYNRYCKLKKDNVIESMTFAFLLINKTDAIVFTVITNYKSRDHENHIFHYTEPEARKIMTAYFYGTGLYSINGINYQIQMYEKTNCDQQSFKVLFPDNEICVGKGNGGGYYKPGGNKPIDVLLFCSKTQCLEVASVTYDETEYVYLMDSTIYRRLVKEFGFPICEYVSRNRNGYVELKEESKLHILGYNVNDNEGMSDAKRQSLLADLVELGFIDISDIVNHLDFLIRLNSNRTPKSIRRWNADKHFIENYRIDHNRFAFFERIRTKAGSYILR